MRRSSPLAAPHFAVGVDVADEQAVPGAVRRVADELAAPTVLVNNAGVTRDNLLFKMITDDWHAVMSVHLRGSFLMSRATQKYMTEAGWGRIVNLSSVSALGHSRPGQLLRGEGWPAGLHQDLAIELSKFGVTVNAVAPGFIETDMTVAGAARARVTFEGSKAPAAAQVPVAHAGQPGDVAATVAFFVRDESSFVSARVIYVAGGPWD